MSALCLYAQPSLFASVLRRSVKGAWRNPRIDVVVGPLAVVALSDVACRARWRAVHQAAVRAVGATKSARTRAAKRVGRAPRALGRDLGVSSVVARVGNRGACSQFASLSRCALRPAAAAVVRVLPGEVDALVAGADGGLLAYAAAFGSGATKRAAVPTHARKTSAVSACAIANEAAGAAIVRIGFRIEARATARGLPAGARRDSRTGGGPGGGTRAAAAPIGCAGINHVGRIPRPDGQVGSSRRATARARAAATRACATSARHGAARRAPPAADREQRNEEDGSESPHRPSPSIRRAATTPRTPRELAPEHVPV